MHARVIPLSAPNLQTGLREACSQCNLRELCLPMGLSGGELDQIDQLVEVRRRIQRGQHLYRGGDDFLAIYAIKTGFFKTDVLLEDGRDQVTGFQMAGEILGMDGIGSEKHTCNAVALEDSEVCVIPFADLENYS
ncbi:MAG: cyclic nucleotide-binding domain-containing protein, partial [Rhodocyclaceae bacterium]|nr:cyclic nucleotide-binding domain-containing protein [Rhodocyclaceae bacterium]